MADLKSEPDPRSARPLQRSMEELAGRFTRRTEIAVTLEAVTSAAVRLIAGVDSADILFISSINEFESLAATSQVPLDADSIQRQYHEGPCVDAAEGEAVIRCNDLREDARWPRFAKAAVQVGVFSVMSFQLYANDVRRGALNLFGAAVSEFDAEAEALGAMLATHAAIAVRAEQREQQFKSALASRDVIGQAKGMIMERFGVDAIQAFELLTALSQDSNKRVADIANDVVEHGAVPQL